MRFGNTWEQFRKAMLSSLVIGAVGCCFSAAMFVFVEKLPLKRLIPLTGILFIPPLTVGLGVAPTLLFSIHITGEWVEHRLCDRWVLSRARASDFRSIQMPAGGFAAKLRFADGTTMKFLGAHLGILASLAAELEQRRTKAESGEA